MFYSSIRLYIQDSKSLEDKICRIDQMITLTEDAILKSATDDDVTEYRLDDGQTKINVSKRSVAQMTSSIQALEALKQIYVNRYNGHVVRLVDRQANNCKL